MTKTILLFIVLAGMLSVGSAHGHTRVTSCSDLQNEFECHKRGCGWKSYGEGSRGKCSGNIKDGEKHPKASPTDAYIKSSAHGHSLRTNTRPTPPLPTAHAHTSCGDYQFRECNDARYFCRWEGRCVNKDQPLPTAHAVTSFCGDYQFRECNDARYFCRWEGRCVNKDNLFAEKEYEENELSSNNNDAAYVSDGIESSPTRSRYLRAGKRDGSFESAY